MTRISQKDLYKALLYWIKNKTMKAPKRYRTAVNRFYECVVYSIIIFFSFDDCVYLEYLKNVCGLAILKFNIQYK